MSLPSFLLELLWMYPIGFGLLCFRFHLNQAMVCSFWLLIWLICYSGFYYLISYFCKFSIFFSRYWSLVLYHCGQKKKLIISILILLRLFFGLILDISLKIFNVHLERMCILLLLDGVFCIWLSGPYDLYLSPLIF